jgi:peptidoglycan/xylan/chitin deacetylase (PgdA/CDA1 family)
MAVDSPLAGVMDNPYYDWSPIVGRPRLTWPGGARIALGVILTLESMSWYPAEGVVLPPAVARIRPGAYPGTPDIHTISQWEYGNRVGAFRVLDVLQRHGITPVVAMDVRVAERAPFLVRRLQDLGAEFVGHGLSADQMITQAMPAAEEQALISDTLERLSAVVGGPVRGWHGSEYAESARTVRLLAAAGLDYVLDWPNDEQPAPMKVPDGRMLNLPVAVELDDIFATYEHHITAPALKQVSVDYFDRLYADGAETGRLLLLNVHPWLTGQPFRIRYFADVIDHICGHPAIWKATGAQIADWYRLLLVDPPGQRDPVTA